MGGLSWWHWIIIIGAFLLLFGAKKLPDAARGVGRSLRILKSEISAMQDEPQPKAVPVTEFPVTHVPVTHVPMPDVPVTDAVIRH